MKSEPKELKQLKAEIKKIAALDSDPLEAMYKWIDQTLGIPEDRFGGALTKVDAIPAYIDMATARVFCTSVPMLHQMLSKLSNPVLCGMGKYDADSGKFLEAILIPGFPEDMHPYLKSRIEWACDHADADFRRGYK